MSKRCFNAKIAPAALGPYSHAVIAGEFVFLSGQTGLDPAMNAIYGKFFASNFPARSTIQVAALPKNGAVEIEVIARSRVAD